jgi:catalase
MHRQDIDTNPANYEPNSINDNWPRETPPGPKRGGFESYQERVDGNKIRERSPSFGEYYAHPRLFWNSQTPIEQQHIIGGFSFELSKVVRTYIRERVVDQLAHIDIQLAQSVADNLGITLTDEQRNLAPPKEVNGVKKDPSLSLYAVPGGSIKGRVVAILLNDKTRASDVLGIMQALKTQGVHAKLLYSRMGEVTADDGSVLPVAATFAGSPSLTVDAVIVPCGDIASLLTNGDAVYYLLEAYKHLKPIALSGDARQFKAQLKVADQGEDGIVEGDNVDDAFMTKLFDLLAAHRVWSRSSKIDQIPA